MSNWIICLGALVIKMENNRNHLEIENKKNYNDKNKKRKNIINKNKKNNEN
jgi:hypothetical protein